MIRENQFDCLPGRYSNETIHVVRRLIEKYKERKKDLHVVLIDLEKEYDSVPRNIIWDSLEIKGISRTYIEAISDMCDGVLTNIQTPVGITDPLLIKVGLHQGSALSPFIFSIIIDELSESILESVPWCMLFADDIVLIIETSEEANTRLMEWRTALKSKGLCISRTKLEYLKCNFSGLE